MVSVLPVRPASVCTPRVCAINHHLPHLRCASGFCAGTSSVVLYTVELISLIERHGLSPHLYADDTQVYGGIQIVTTVEGQRTTDTHKLTDNETFQEL